MLSVSKTWFRQRGLEYYKIRCNRSVRETAVIKENALKPVLLITLTILLPNSLSIAEPKGEFVHESNKSPGGSCSKSPLTSQKLSCYAVVALRPLLCCFPVWEGNRKKQWEQGEKGEWVSGAGQKATQSAGLKVGGICRGLFNAEYRTWVLLLCHKAG